MNSDAKAIDKSPVTQPIYRWNYIHTVNTGHLTDNNKTRRIDNTPTHPDFMGLVVSVLPWEAACLISGAGEHWVCWQILNHACVASVAQVHHSTCRRQSRSNYVKCTQHLKRSHSGGGMCLYVHVVSELFEICVPHRENLQARHFKSQLLRQSEKCWTRCVGPQLAEFLHL